MLAWLFWLLCLAAIYSYFLYPLLLWLAARWFSPPGVQLASPGPLPSLSLIITAYNEKNRIRQKLDNTLAVDYPRDRLQIIVASDCSDDGTDAIVGEYADRGVQLVRAPERLGKEHAQRCAIAEAGGEVIVFSDVATEIPADALQQLAAAFADPTVGAVSSEDRFISRDGTVAGEGAYVKYEMWLRQLESRLAGLVGLSGSFFAARRSVCADWDIHSPSDFNTALNCRKLGYRAITRPDVLGYYPDLADPQKEYQRKVRTVLRGITGLGRHREMLNVFRYGWFAWQVWSHKLMRWLVPWLLLAVLVLNLALLGEGVIYPLILLGQLLFYGLALLGWRVEAARSNALVKLVFFFVQVNVAIAQACLRYFSGQRMTVWTPSQR